MEGYAIVPQPTAASLANRRRAWGSSIPQSTLPLTDVARTADHRHDTPFR